MMCRILLRPFSYATKGRDSETVLGGRVEAVENNPSWYSDRHPIDTV
jgi:hypothetical protein